MRAFLIPHGNGRVRRLLWWFACARSVDAEVIAESLQGDRETSRNEMKAPRPAEPKGRAPNFGGRLKLSDKPPG